jgi:hypothetical protein
MDVALGLKADAVGVEVHQSTADLLRKLMGPPATTTATVQPDATHAQPAAAR